MPDVVQAGEAEGLLGLEPDMDGLFSLVGCSPFVEPVGYDQAALIHECLFEALLFGYCLGSCVDHFVRDLLLFGPGRQESPPAGAERAFAVLPYDRHLMRGRYIVVGLRIK